MMLKHLLSSGANADQPDPRDTQQQQQQQQYHSYTQQSFAPEYKYEVCPILILCLFLFLTNIRRGKFNF